MANAEEHCAKVELEDGRQLYFSIKQKTELSNLGWSIILTDGDKVWDTVVGENDLKDMAVGSSYTPEQFIQLFETAFKLKEPDEDTTLRYTLKALSAGKDCFFWSIYLPKDDKIFRLGSLNISPLTEMERVPVYCRMFNSLLSVSDMFRKQAELSRAESAEQRAVTKSALQKLDKFTVVQETAEKVLYTNFVAVLNEKKRKIRELQDQCDALKESLSQNLDAAEKSTPETGPSKTSKRGRGSKARGAQAKKVSACTAPKKSRNDGNVRGDIEFEDSAGVDDQPSADITPGPQHGRRAIESSDEDTDIDDTTEKDSGAMIQSQSETEPIATSITVSTATDSWAAPAMSEPSSSTSTLTAKPALAHPSAGDKLDDLLGGSELDSKMEKKSPVKRMRVTRRSVAPPAKDPPTKSVRKSAAGTSSERLIDDLLGEM
ncbi:DNA repair protein XRCC4-like isoform X2 [Watersipora subatra]